MKLLFSLVILANSALLFWVELLYGKKLLPTLGGAPAVWNTCLMFYQAILLAGYAYGMGVTRLRFRAQLLVHGALLGLTVVGLPWFLFVWPDPGSWSPILWVLLLLTLSVGPPLLVLAAGSLLLQRWFSLSDHPDRGDPYFLYAASNLGSFLGLAAYPLLLEPFLTLEQQTTSWRISYALVALLIVAGGAWALRSRKRVSLTLDSGARDDAGTGNPAPAPSPSSSGEAPGGPAHTATPSARGAMDDPVTPIRRLKWVGLAFLPSSLLLGVTTHITSEIAPVPLLWVVPLALYLLTFVVAFGPGRIVPAALSQEGPDPGASPGRSRRLLRAVGWVLGGLLATLLLAALVLGVGRLQWLWVLAHLGMLGLAGVVCHVKLARDRPDPRHLAEFYLWLALGGALGGAFNALVAPLVFVDPLEYPLALALLAFVVASGARRGKAGFRPGDVALGILPGAAAWALARWAGGAGLDPLLLLAVPAALCLVLAGRPVRFGLGVAGLVLVGFLHPVMGGQVVHKERTFFGIHRIYQDDGYLWLAHGTTVHGGQHRDRPGEPLTYYHPAGPSRALFLDPGLWGGPELPGLERVAIVGLGTGSQIAYARPGQVWSLYGIDPAVIRIAEEPRFFTYLRDAPVPYRHVLGDARLSLEREEGRYHLLVVDAFTSDAVPVHLLTVDAVTSYLERLEGGGLLAFHISNRYLDLSRVLADVAGALDLEAYVARDEAGDMTRGYYPSHWVALSRDVRTFQDPRWRVLEPTGRPPWTDSYSSLLPLMRW
jgi:hypothetical protein